MSDSPRPDADRNDVPRRPFLVRAAAVVAGGIVALFPAAAGLVVFCDPLRRQRAEARFVRVAPLGALPDDGVPRRFNIVDRRVDAWNRYPPAAIGAVYLVRPPGEATPRSLSVVCPHLGCAVDFAPQADEYRCPCHTSGFSPDGEVLYGPSPRALDTLEVEVRDEDIYVRYERFRSGIAAKEVE